eukprot:8859115-Pyramimonas_sp.AAC.1
MARTLLRRQEFIDIDPGVDVPFMDREEFRDAPESEFLNMWNGCWTAGRIQHWCSGPRCCENVEECRKQMYATAISVDLLQGSDTRTPSLDDF